jgi:DNA repair protein RecO (recombination protein O)
MPLVHTEALILRTYNLADADRIVLCLTRSAGLIRAVAKGARRMKSRFGAALEPFTLVKLIFHEKENRELVTISQVDIVKSHFALAGDQGAANALAYIGELVVEFAPPHEVNEKLFRMVVACVDAISAVPREVELVARYFEVWLLRLAGFWPDLRSCADCHEPVSAGGLYLNAEGRPRCHPCSRGTGAAVTREVHEVLLATQRLPPSEFARYYGNLAPGVREQLADMTHRLVVRVLERPPRTAARWFETEALPDGLAPAVAGGRESS